MVLILVVILVYKYWSSQKLVVHKNVTATTPTSVKETAVAIEELSEATDKKTSVYDGLNNLLDAYAKGEESAVIEIARIYMFGVHPYFLANKLNAGKVCQYVIYTDHFSPTAKQNARDLMKEVQYDDIPLNDRDYYALPTDPVAMLAEIGVNVQEIKAMPAMATAPPPPPPRRTQNNNQIGAGFATDIFAPNNTFNFDINFDDIDIDQQAAIFAQFAPPPVNVMNDGQNVHSTAVQNAAKQRLDSITPAPQATNINTQLNNANTNKQNSFYTFLQNDTTMTNNEKDKVRQVLASLQSTPHSRYDQSEKQVFDTVWGRINAPVNAANRDEMAKVFAQNIASAMENDYVVCSTGKIVRMLGSLDVMDADTATAAPLRPEWALDAEMAGKAAQIRESVLAAATDRDKKLYEEGSAPHIEEEMKANLRNSLRADYVDTQLVSSDAIDLKWNTLCLGF